VHFLDGAWFSYHKMGFFDFIGNNFILKFTDLEPELFNKICLLMKFNFKLLIEHYNLILLFNQLEGLLTSLCQLIVYFVHFIYVVMGDFIF
jgi:hypothetical protein